MVTEIVVRVPSTSNPDDTHNVTIFHHVEETHQYDRYACDCKGFTFERTKYCRHILAVVGAWWQTLRYDAAELESIIREQT